MVLIATYTHGVLAEEVGCIDEIDYQKTKGTYADMIAKYDPPTVAQAFLEATSATENLKEQVSTCQKTLNDPDQNRCDPLVKQYNDKRIVRDDLSKRLSVALKMQEYLLTLKLKLERPRCAKQILRN